MRKVWFVFFAIVLIASTSCELKLKQYGDDGQETLVEVLRYDRLESRYLTTGDFSALQQMNIEYPVETRMLIEDVLNLGEVNDHEINSKFLNFYQDTVLQAIINEAELQYSNMADINNQLSSAFKRLQKMCPDIKTPTVYAQISALNQSIIIGNNSIGISLDKYLGRDFPIYRRYYTEEQRQQMVREAIVPDCMSFYLLSLYPLDHHDTLTQYQRDVHMGKIMWIVNHLIGRKYFNTKYTAIVDRYVRTNPKLTLKNILELEIIL